MRTAFQYKIPVDYDSIIVIKTIYYYTLHIQRQKQNSDLNNLFNNQLI